MTGPVVPIGRTTSRGRNRRFLLLAGIMVLSWPLWQDVRGIRVRPLPGSSGFGVAGALAGEEAGAADRAEAGAIETYIALKPAASASPVADHCDERAVPIAQAIAAIAECQARYRAIRDYTCTFSKRERIKGKLTPLHVLTMKVRTQPKSIYIRFQRPAAGREAIYIAGQNDGKVLVHDVGLNKLLAGTLRLDPTGSRAMQDNRHPITHAGIGSLLDTLETRWSSELHPEESVVVIREDQEVQGRLCQMIETTHPVRQSNYMFYRVRVFIDGQLGLPIHFEAYDWPSSPLAQADLMEEYSYKDIKLNVGLSDRDFDVSNVDYAFGRF